jgi:hypothetical protein
LFFQRKFTFSQCAANDFNPACRTGFIVNLARLMVIYVSTHALSVWLKLVRKTVFSVKNTPGISPKKYCLLEFKRVPLKLSNGPLKQSPDESKSQKEHPEYFLKITSLTPFRNKLS